MSRALKVRLSDSQCETPHRVDGLCHEAWQNLIWRLKEQGHLFLAADSLGLTPTKQKEKKPKYRIFRTAGITKVGFILLKSTVRVEMKMLHCWAQRQPVLMFRHRATGDVSVSTVAKAADFSSDSSGQKAW